MEKQKKVMVMMVMELMAMMIMMNDGHGDDVDGYVEHARGGESGSDRSVEEGRGANQL